MLRPTFSIPFTALILLLLTGCRAPSEEQVLCDSHSFSRHPALVISDLELVYQKLFIESDTLLSNEFLFEFKHAFNQVEHPQLLRLTARIKLSEFPEKLIFVTSVKSGDRDVIWEGHNLIQEIDRTNDWVYISAEVLIPSSEASEHLLLVYLWNPESAEIQVEHYQVELFNDPVPSFMPEIKYVEATEGHQVMNDSRNHQVRFNAQNGQLILADSEGQPLTHPIGWVLELNNDSTVHRCSGFSWRRENDNFIANHSYEGTELEMVVAFQSSKPGGAPQLQISAEINGDLKLHRLALSVNLVHPITTVFDAYGNSHHPIVEPEYHNVRGGWISGDKNLSLAAFHSKGLSSTQIHAPRRQILFNLDYLWDHPMMYCPLNADSSDYFVDRSATLLDSAKSFSAVVPLYVGETITTLPRFLSVQGGYLSALVFTEHSDWTNMRTHRAVCYGHEDIKSPHTSTGGFVHYDIPVTKSVFYDNPDSVDNARVSDSLFTELHSSIRSDEDFLPFLRDLSNEWFEICLHTPAQYTDSREQMREALAFVQNEFGSLTWIDHGYDNAPSKNREDLVCDGITEGSENYSRDLWQEHDVRYFWHPYYEDHPVYLRWSFSSHMQMPYPGFGTGFPYYPIAQHPNFDEALLWYTNSVASLPDEAMWDYLFSYERLEQLAQYKGIHIIHMYPAWVKSGKGFWVFDESGKIVANPGMNRALARIAQLREEKKILPVTVGELLGYFEALQKLEYNVIAPRHVEVTNTSMETLKGCSMILSSSQVYVDGESPQNESHEGELVFWFDLEAGQTAQITWK